MHHSRGSGQVVRNGASSRYACGATQDRPRHVKAALRRGGPHSKLQLCFRRRGRFRPLCPWCIFVSELPLGPEPAEGCRFR